MRMKKLFPLPCELRADIQRTLERIIKELDQVEENRNPPSLFNGNMGISLLFFYYSRFVQSEYYEYRAMSFLEASLNSIDLKMNGTLCNGLGGVFWGLKHLMSNGFLEKDKFYLDLFRSYLCEDISYQGTIGNFDYLHGSIGSANVLLGEIAVDEVYVCITGLIDSLCNFVKYDQNGLFWECIKGEKINISLSHGLSSICVFLVKAYNLNLKREIVMKLLKGGIKYLLSQENLNSNRISMYPSFSLKDKIYQTSRLGWCYGDLGIAIALWYYLNTFKDNFIEQKFFEILEFSSCRRDKEYTGVKEPGICHGAAGISLIFRKMYNYIGDERSYNVAIYWLSQILKMSKCNEGIAGFRYGEDVNSIDLLTGITGVGLLLLSFLMPSSVNWDECLLLS